MVGEQIVKQMKARAELMGKYYLRGFGNLLAGATADACNYLDYPNVRDESKNHALSCYSIINDFYQKIPFNELEGNEDFSPLFSTRELLPEYKKQLDAIFQNPTKQALDELSIIHRKIMDIVEVKNSYRWRFWGLTKQIRTIPGNEDFYVKVVDINGYEWRF
jgi:hypothetical protein